MILLAFVLLAACSREDGTEKAAPPVADQAVDTAPSMPRTRAPADARVLFKAPADGATVSGTFAVEFGTEGMAIVRAGDNTPASGHHHLLVDIGLPDPGMPIPADANHLHFGDGSTSTELTLAPGEHTLQLLLGDHLHIPHDPPVYSEQITVTVE
jgi:hypothetical protein